MGLRELVLVALVVVGAVRALGRGEEPPGPDDLAVDLAPVAQAGPARGPVKRRARPGRVNRQYRRNEARNPVSCSGKPLVLVLDDPGRDRRGRLDHLSRDDRRALPATVTH